MASTITQEIIDNLIQSIHDAEEQGSITNEMVAEILTYLNTRYKDILKMQTHKADLDASGHLKLAQIPNGVSDVVAFDELITTEIPESKIIRSVNKWSTDADAYVVFNTYHNRFFLRVPDGYSSNYYTNWLDRDRFGVHHSNGVTPYPHKTYSTLFDCSIAGDESDMRPGYFRWDGKSLTSALPIESAAIQYAYGISSDEKNEDGSNKFKIYNGKYTVYPNDVIVYNAKTKRFMHHTVAANGQRSLFTDWIGSEIYGTPAPEGNGIIPHPFKIYRNSIDGSYQQWNGEQLTTPLSAYEVQAALLSTQGTYNALINSLRVKDDALMENIESLLNDVENLAINTNSIVDLGTFLSDTEAFAAAADPEIVNNPQARILVWRARNSSAGIGYGGTIFQERYYDYYVTQWMMFEGPHRVCKVRCITTGGNYSVGEWQNIIMPSTIEYDKATRSIKAWSPEGTLGHDEPTVIGSVELPLATATDAGLMSATDKTKLDAAANLQNIAESIVDLGIVTDFNEAADKALADDIINNPKVRKIIWRTTDQTTTTNFPGGKGGTIFQERPGSPLESQGWWRVVQWTMFEGDSFQCKARRIRLGGTPGIGPWIDILNVSLPEPPYE